MSHKKIHNVEVKTISDGEVKLIPVKGTRKFGAGIIKQIDSLSKMQGDLQSDDPKRVKTGEKKIKAMGKSFFRI